MSCLPASAAAPCGSWGTARPGETLTPLADPHPGLGPGCWASSAHCSCVTNGRAADADAGCVRLRPSLPFLITHTTAGRPHARTLPSSQALLLLGGMFPERVCAHPAPHVSHQGRPAAAGCNGVGQPVCMAAALHQRQWRNHGTGTKAFGCSPHAPCDAVLSAGRAPNPVAAALA